MMGETAVNVTPWIRGSRTPTFQNPTDWMIVAMPQVKRSALMRWMRSWVERSKAPAMTIGTITAPA